MALIDPDRAFLKKLHRVDKRLGCFFNERIEKFIITYQRATGEPVPIAKVAGRDEETGVFRQPNDVDLEFVRSGDMTNTRIKDRLMRVSDYMERERELDRKRSREYFRDQTKDDKIQLMQRFSKAAGVGKCNSAFRRIDAKPKQRGEVIAAKEI
jgi:hypothetical protein